MTQPASVFVGSTVKYSSISAGYDFGPDVTITNGSTDPSGPFQCTMVLLGLPTSLAVPSPGNATTALAYQQGVRSYNPPTGVGTTIAAAVFAAKGALYSAAGLTGYTLAQYGYAEKRIAMAVALATLDYNTQASGQAVPLPTPSGYGYDLSCVTDLDPMAIEVSGYTVLAQALVRRISTPRGGLIDDPNYGFDVPGLLKDDMTPAQIAQIGPQIDAEFLKDERVLSSQTTATFLAGSLLTSSVVVGASGPFKLTLAINELTIAILKATPT
jgi:hypothetical protein